MRIVIKSVLSKEDKDLAQEIVDLVCNKFPDRADTEGSLISMDGSKDVIILLKDN